MMTPDDRTRTYRTPCMADDAHVSDGLYVTGPSLVLTDYASLAELQADLRRVGSHYFSAGARRFFGVRGVELVTGCTTVEEQRNAPDGMPRFRVALWIVDRNGEPATPGGCRHETRAEARACARRYADFLADPAAVEIVR